MMNFKSKNVKIKCWKDEQPVRPCQRRTRRGHTAPQPAVKMSQDGESQEAEGGLQNLYPINQDVGRWALGIKVGMLFDDKRIN